MTAGPEDRTLRVITGGGPETEEQAEQRIRDDLHRLGVGPGGPASSPPPMPLHPPTIPSQPVPVDVAREEPQTVVPARAANDRLTPWWERRKPDLADQEQAAAEPDEQTAPEGEDEEPEPDPEPKAKGRGPRPGRRRVSKTSRPAADNGDGDEEEGEGEEGAPDVPRWSRPTLGRPPGLPPKRQNLVTWWREIEKHNKWLMYHGTGLGAGVFFGVFTWGTNGAEFVTQEGLGDLEADVTLGLLGLVLIVDYRVRNLFPPLAWAVRGISTSLIIGAAWNGVPLADLTN